MVRVRVAVALGLVVLLIGACAPTPRDAPASAAPSADGVAAQDCSVRLHELCEQLLVYNARNRMLPRDLIELSTTASSPACPASREPYLYNPAGWPVGKVGEHVIVCDARPTHLGVRMGILIQPSEPGEPLVLKVASLPRGFDPR